MASKRHQAGATPDSARILDDQVAAFKRRNKLACDLLPVAIGIAVTAGWVGVCVVVTALSLWPIASYLATPVVYVGASFLAYRACNLRRIARYRHAAVCVYCDYDLGGVREDAARCRCCPECGKPNVPLRVRFTIRHGMRAEITPADLATRADRCGRQTQPRSL